MQRRMPTRALPRVCRRLLTRAVVGSTPQEEFRGPGEFAAAPEKKEQNRTKKKGLEGSDSQLKGTREERT